MAGGYKKFGPTYNSTPYVRLGYEGFLNGAHGFDPALLGGVDSTEEPHVDLAGKFAAMGAGGVKLAGAGGKNAVGLFREDLQDMVNASEKATFYFRGGEYYVRADRAADGAFDALAIGDEITCDANGDIVKLTAIDGSEKALGVVTHLGAYVSGNMYEHATAAADHMNYIGFIMFI